MPTISMAPDTGTLSYQSGVAQDQALYSEVFAPDTLALRAIALGLSGTAGNSRDAATAGVSNANRLFNVGLASFERDLMRSGRGTAETRVIAQVDAGNRASRAAAQNRREAQAFGSQFYSDSIVGANNMLAKIAGAETDRDTQWRSARQNAISGSLGLGGAVTGATLSFI
jgi:hypothetical protein